MQTVFICGGRGTRLARSGGPKSLVQVGGITLLEGLVSTFRPFHTSTSPPVVVVDRGDELTPRALTSLLPNATIVRQPVPDGVASALLLARPFIDDVAIFTLGDLFLDGHFGDIPQRSSLMFWRGASPDAVTRNFGVVVGPDGAADAVVEKPADSDGLACGIGVYVLTPATISTFHAVPRDPVTGERGITDGIQAAIAAGVRFQLTPFVGFYTNINTRSDLAAVENHLARPVCG